MEASLTITKAYKMYDKEVDGECRAIKKYSAGENAKPTLLEDSGRAKLRTCYDTLPTSADCSIEELLLETRIISQNSIPLSLVAAKSQRGFFSSRSCRNLCSKPCWIQNRFESR